MRCDDNKLHWNIVDISSLCMNVLDLNASAFYTYVFFMVTIIKTLMRAVAILPSNIDAMSYSISFTSIHSVSCPMMMWIYAWQFLYGNERCLIRYTHWLFLWFNLCACVCFPASFVAISVIFNLCFQIKIIPEKKFHTILQRKSKWIKIKEK